MLAWSDPANVALTDRRGRVVWAADYMPFGNIVRPRHGDDDHGDHGKGRHWKVTNNFRFPGQYYDAETGLNYNMNRDYDPALGRYIESDPLGLRAGFNTYVYGYDSPAKYFDLSGLLACTYDINAHHLTCTNNAGSSLSIDGSHVKAGHGKCMNNASCTEKKNKGPLPVGNYQIHEPGYSPNKPKWLYLEPSENNNMYTRGGFFIHPWGISNGCITIYYNSDFKTLSDWVVQDHGGSLHVVQ